MKLSEILLERNWGVKSTGEWNGMSKSDIQHVADRLRSKKTRSAEDTRRLRAANFAIRAKKAHGKKWAGVKAS